MTEHDLRLIEIGEKVGAEKATKQIVEWLRSASNGGETIKFANLFADEIEAGEPFQ